MAHHYECAVREWIRNAPPLEPKPPCTCRFTPTEGNDR